MDRTRIGESGLRRKREWITEGRSFGRLQEGTQDTLESRVIASFCEEDSLLAILRKKERKVERDAKRVNAVFFSHLFESPNFLPVPQLTLTRQLDLNTTHRRVLQPHRQAEEWSLQQVELNPLLLLL